MGGGRLSREETLRGRLVGLMVLVAMLCTGCPLSGDGANAEPTATADPSATATPSPAPSPTATPNPLAKPPASQFEAREWLERYLSPRGWEPPCPEELREAGVACASGDIDADGRADHAYLVPVKPLNSRAPFPAVVFVRRAAMGKVEEFAIDMTADASILGRAFFAVAERTGDVPAELAFLRNLCSATGCSTLAVLMRWDGTAWRDAGPGDEGILNVDRVEWSGSGALSELTIHGGKLPDEAGPTRGKLTTFRLEGGRYTAVEEEPDEPDYLYHAVEDADRLFEEDLTAAIAAYSAIVSDTELKDWKPRADSPDRRPALKGYALFRIAVARAAQGSDPTAALDAVIRESKEPLFVNIAEEFRRGYQERRGVIAGCAAVNLYLSKPVPGTDTAAYVEKLFDYGYANPPGRTWLTRICPY